MNDTDQAITPLVGISVVPKPSAKLLNKRQLIDYRTEREQCLEWLLTFGIDPKRGEGYAKTTVMNRASRMIQFYRWVWNKEGGYTSGLTQEHADAYLRYLAGQESSNAHKNACRKAVMMLYKWRYHRRGADQWEPKMTFFSAEPVHYPARLFNTQGADTYSGCLTRIWECPKLRERVWEKRDRWKIYLSQRFEKPKSEITKVD